MFEMKRPPIRNYTHTKGAPPFRAFISFLNANPGQWCLYHTYNVKQTGHQRAMRGNKEFGPSGYEFTSRNTEDGVAVYGRFVGNNATHTQEDE